MKKIVFILLVCLFFCACKRTQFVQANLEKPANAPAYTQEAVPNSPPNYPTPSLHGS